MTGIWSVIHDEEALEALIPAWTELWRRHTEATPFQAPQWLGAWWRAFRPGGLRVVAWRRAGELGGVLPLYEDGGVLRLLGAGTTDLQDVIFPHDALEGALERAAAAAPGAVFDLFDLVEGSALVDAAAPDGWGDRRERWAVCPERTLPLAEPRFLRHARSRAARLGGWAVRRADGDTLDRDLDILAALHGARWAGRGEPGVLADPRMRMFLGEAARGLLEVGVLRLNVLAVGGRTAAAHFGLNRGGAAHYYLGGFDPDQAWASPGTLAVGHALEEAVAEGVRVFRLLRGGEAYKYRWGAVDRVTWRRMLWPIPASSP